VACIAIAGFPIANGFYSKDEILFKAFTSDHLALFGSPTPWLGPAIYLLGILTATGTAFYMYRSYYLTFTGEYRGSKEPGGHGGHGEEHGHGGHLPKESPWTVTAVLVTLALGSVLTLLLGIPALWSGTAPLFERWLEPVLAQVRFREAPGATEWLFQGFGVLAALVGFLFARALYKDGRSEVPERLKARFQGAWQVVYEKYYVDQLYDRALVRPLVLLASFLAAFDRRIIDGLVELLAGLVRLIAQLDALIDRYLVDGAVNAVADGTVALGRSLRKVQSGHIQTYLYGALGGALVIVLLNFLLR